MTRMARIQFSLTCSFLIMALSGCTRSGIESNRIQSGNASFYAASAPISVPSDAVYISKRSYEAALINSGANANRIGKEVNHIGQQPYALYDQNPNMHHCSLQDSYKYMGSKGDYHFIAHYPAISLMIKHRSTLRINKTTYHIMDEFPLTTDTKKWRPIPTHENKGLLIQDWEINPHLNDFGRRQIFVRMNDTDEKHQQDVENWLNQFRVKLPADAIQVNKPNIPE